MVSTSQRIRDLHKEGLTKGAIAKELGIRFQFVYNVLRRDEDKAILDAHRKSQAANQK